MPDLRTLEIYYWTATLSSFSRAAERLNTTQPAVSQRIAALEREFGLTLIARGRGAITLTPKGRELLVFAERFLHLRTEMVAAIASPAATTGVLRLGVSETIVHTWLMPFIEAMGRTYPGVAVDIAVDVSPNMRDALLRRELDLALLVGPITMPSLINIALCRFSVAWIAAPHLDFGTGAIGLAELTRYPVITYPRNTNPYAQLHELLARSNVPPPRLYSSASLSTIARMAIEGIGVGVIPAETVRSELADGRLRVLDTAVRLPDIGFTATYENAPDNGLAAIAADIAGRIARAWCGTSAGSELGGPDRA